MRCVSVNEKARKQDKEPGGWSFSQAIKPLPINVKGEDAVRIFIYLRDSVCVIVICNKTTKKLSARAMRPS